MKQSRYVRFSRVRKNISSRFHSVTKHFPRKRIAETVTAHPFVSFFASLLLVFLLIALGTLLAPRPEEVVEDVNVKAVRVYSIGTGPTIQTQAQITKTGVINIFAQTQGVVQTVNVKEGDEVVLGTQLMSLSTNYSGGNVPSLQAGIARQQYQNAVDTFDTQKELIETQREVARTTDENTDELREISEESLSDTRNVLGLNESILGTINDTIEQFEDANTPETDQQFLQARQSRAQLQAAVNQLRSTVRTTEYQTDEDNPPTELANLQREITLKQLDVQEKSLELGREVARLQLQVAQVQASLMNPSSPSNGTIQRVHVQFGDSVSPGTLLVTFFQPAHENMAVANVNSRLASSVSLSEASTLFLDDERTIRVVPRFVSTEATDGQLYAVIYTIPEEYTDLITNQEFITVNIPLVIGDTSSTIPLIPIDAVYKTEQSAYVFVLEGGRVVVRTVEVGEIVGSYIEINEGLTNGDQVILDRSVIAGETVIIDNT